MAQIIPLTTEEIRAGYTHKVVLTGADIALLTSGTAASIYPAFNSAATKTGLLVLNAAVYVKSAVTLGGTLTMSVGDTASGYAYVGTGEGLGVDCKTSATIGNGVQTAASLKPSANVINVKFVGGVALSSASGGEIHIYLTLADLAELSK